MPITTLMLMYASSNVSSVICSVYLTAGALVGAGAAFGGIYLSQTESSEESKNKPIQALNDMIELIMSPELSAIDFQQKIDLYQHVLDEKTIEFLKKDFQLRHPPKSFFPDENGAFSSNYKRKKVKVFNMAS